MMFMTFGTSSERRRGRRTGRRSAALASLLILGLVAACDSAEERARGHLESGLALLAEGNPVKAAIEFRNAIRLDKTLAVAHMELGKIVQDNGNLAVASNHLRTAAELDETLMEAHLHYGQIMLTANKVDEALESSITAFQLAPDNIDVLVLKAAVAVRLENFESARSTIADGLALDDANPDFYILLAGMERRDGNPEKALETTRLGMEKAPDNVALRILEIDLLGALGRSDEIGRALDEIIERREEDMAFREARVRWLLSRQQFVEAEEELRAMAALEPDNTNRALDVVRMVLRTRGVDAALEEMNRLIAEAETPAAAFPYTMAKVQFHTLRRQIPEAEAVLREAMEALGDSTEGREATLALARLQLAQERIDETEALVEQILSRDGANTGALTLRGRMAVLDGRYDEAIKDLRLAVQNSPENVEALHTLAAALQRNGNLQLAGERLADAVEVSDYAPASSLLYAQYLASTDKVDFAASLIETSLQRHPDNRDLLELLARLRLAQRDWAGAEQVGRRLQEIERDPDRADQIVAAALNAQDRTDESIELLRSTDIDRSTETSRLASLIATFLEADKTAEAKEFLDQALAQNPDNGEIIRLQAVLAERDGDIAGAQELFREAVAKAPSDPRMHGALARHLVRIGKPEEAEKVVTAGLDMVPETEANGLKIVLASLMEKRGAVDQAIAVYETMADREPVALVVANNLASLLADNEPTPEMIDRAYNMAKRLRGSEVPFFMDTYGWLLHLKGDSETALQVLSEAAEKLPNNPVVLYHLGTVQAALGQLDSSRETLTAAVRFGEGSNLPQVARARERLEELPPPVEGAE